MCCVIEPARLSNTVIYAAEVQRPDIGEVLHVIGYQNSAENQTKGPNAMILPIPVKKDEPLGPGNIIDTRGFKDILSDYGKAVERLNPHKRLTRSRGFDEVSLGVASNGYQVFESGNYTVALSDTPAGLQKALKHVPEGKRPEIPTRFLIALGKLYADWPIAICCFDGDLEDPEPLLWWFRPRFPKVLFAPAIDAHDGNPPSIEQQVERDHILAFSSFRMAGDYDRALMGDIQMVPADKQWLFGPRIKGRTIKGKTGNGDFTLPVSALTDDNVPAWLPTIDVTAPPKEPLSRYEHILQDNTV